MCLCIAFSAAVIWRWLKDGLTAASRVLAGLFIAVIVSFGLAAVAFCQWRWASGGMIRHLGSSPYRSWPIPWEHFTLQQLNLRHLVTSCLTPSDLNVIGGIYLGPLALPGLLLCVVIYARGDAFARFLLLTFGAITVYFLLAGFGTHFGLAYLHFYIPLLNGSEKLADTM
jgi:hypothetical protein